MNDHKHARKNHRRYVKNVANPNKQTKVEVQKKPTSLGTLGDMFGDVLKQAVVK